MKKSIHIFCYFIFVNAYLGIDKNELAKFKADSKKFSESINISNVKSGKATKDDLIKPKTSFFGSLFSSKSKDDANKNNPKSNDSKPKTSFFGSLFSSKSKDNNKINTQDKINNKVTETYEDPFGSLDANLFDAVGKTKLKSDVKQANTDQKKINKKIAEDKAAAKKKDSGFFASLGSSIKSGMKSLAKSDIGQQVGGVLKNSAVSVASNAVATGTEKLNQEVSSLNNKISGNEKKDLEINTKKDPEVELINKIEDNFDNKEDNVINDLDEINEDSNDAADIKSFSKELDNKTLVSGINNTNSNNQVASVMHHQLPISGRSSAKSAKSKKNKKSKGKSYKKR